MVSENVAKVLTLKDEPKELSDLRTRLQDLVRMSRNTMKEYYPIWKRNDQVYRGERMWDLEDRKAQKRNEPAKVFVPMTHTQVQTFVSFGTTLLTSKDHFFELDGSGIEDAKPAKLAQATLQRDLEHNKWEGILLPQLLTDVARFGLCVAKSQWTRETCPYQTTVPDPKFKPVPGMPTQVQPPMIQQWQEKTKYLGNMIEVVSPFRWFPDTRLPLTRYRDGEFCADENEYSISKLKKMEKDGEAFGVDNIPRLPDDAFSDRTLAGITQETNARFDPTINPRDSAHFVLITEVELRCNPSQTLIAENTPIDPDLNADVVMLFWIANDGRIVSIRDSGYEHNDFLYDAAQFFNDQQRLCNYGIVELLGPMQDILDWLMNSRVTNVRKAVQNFLVVDPKGVKMSDVLDRLPVIRLNSAVPEGMSIDNFIKQLQVTDVTSSHVADMGVVKGFSQEATGLQDNLLGQYAEGRRSAREASNVNANASARVIVPLKGIWEGCILPLGRKMLSNLRQGLDDEQLVRIIGVQRFIENSQPDQNSPYSPPPVRAFLPVDKSQLVGAYDFLVFEGTLPSQRMAVAASILQLGEMLIKNPAVVLALGIDPQLLVYEWLELQGVRNAERFRLTPQRLGQLMQMAQLAGNGGSPPAPPGPGGPSGPRR